MTLWKHSEKKNKKGGKNKQKQTQGLFLKIFKRRQMRHSSMGKKGDVFWNKENDVTPKTHPSARLPIKVVNPSSEM